MRSLVRLWLTVVLFLYSHAEEASCDGGSDPHKYLERVGFFSKSMPAESIKELRRAHHVPYKPSISTTYEVQTLRCSINLVLFIWSCSLQKWFEKAGFQSCFLCIWFQDSHLSVSHSGSQEGLGNDTKSDNWGDWMGTFTSMVTDCQEMQNFPLLSAA